ncbi:hypothetical protein QUF75_17810 [Desulfococcaceae bacterium HSG7]|nr:hypothetical protein [Desulfococcaceae bacterium HSG7]
MKNTLLFILIVFGFFQYAHAQNQNGNNKENSGFQSNYQNDFESNQALVTKITLKLNNRKELSETIDKLEKRRKKHFEAYISWKNKNPARAKIEMTFSIKYRDLINTAFKNLVNYGEHALNTGKYNEAINYFENSLLIKPNHSYVDENINKTYSQWVTWTMALFDKGNNSEASKEFEIFRKSCSKNCDKYLSGETKHYLERAKKHYELGKIEEADRILSWLKKIIPQECRDLVNTVSKNIVNHGENALDMGKYPEAINYFERALLIKSNHSVNKKIDKTYFHSVKKKIDQTYFQWAKWATSLFDKGSDSEARKELKQLRKSCGKSCKKYRSNKTKKIIAHLEQLLRFTELKEAVNLFWSGKKQKAAEELKKIRSLYKNCTRCQSLIKAKQNANYKKGVRVFKKKKFKKTVEFMELAELIHASNNINNIKIYQKLARCMLNGINFFNDKNYKQSIIEFKKAILSNALNESSHKQMAEKYIEKANRNIGKTDYNLFERELNEAIRLFLFGNKQRADEYLKKARLLNKNCAKCQNLIKDKQKESYNKGVKAFKNKEFNETMKFMELAEWINPESDISNTKEYKKLAQCMLNGINFFNDKNYKQSIIEFKKAILPNALNEISHRQMAEGYIEKANHNLDEFLKYHYDQGRKFFQAEALCKALQHFERIRLVHPSYKDIDINIRLINNQLKADKKRCADANGE